MPLIDWKMVSLAPPGLATRAALLTTAPVPRLEPLVICSVPALMVVVPV